MQELSHRASKSALGRETVSVHDVRPELQDEAIVAGPREPSSWREAVHVRDLRPRFHHQGPLQEPSEDTLGHGQSPIPVRGVQQDVCQQELPQHASAHSHGREAVSVRGLRKGIPDEGRSQDPLDHAYRREELQMRNMRKGVRSTCGATLSSAIAHGRASLQMRRVQQNVHAVQSDGNSQAFAHRRTAVQMRRVRQRLCVQVNHDVSPKEASRYNDSRAKGRVYKRGRRDQNHPLVRYRGQRFTRRNSNRRRLKKKSQGEKDVRTNLRENRGKVQSSGVLRKFHPHLLHNKLLSSHHSVFFTNVYSKTLYKTIFTRSRVLVVYENTIKSYTELLMR